MATKASSLRLVDGDEELILAPEIGASYFDPIWVISNSLESAAPRVVDSNRLGRSGKRDRTYLHDGAVFTAELQIPGDTTQTRYQVYEKLQGMLHPGKRPYLYFKRDGWTSERRCMLRGDSYSCVVDKDSRTRLAVSINCVIPEGVIEANEATIVTLRPGVTSTGRVYPFTFPRLYPAGSNSNTSTLFIEGNEVTPPFIRVWGACTDINFLVERDGQETQQLKFLNLNIPSGHYLTIDVADRAIYLDDTTDVSYLSKLDFSVADYWEFEPGENRVIFTAASADLGCYAEITYSPHWLP